METEEFAVGDLLNPDDDINDAIIPEDVESETFIEDFLDFETETTQVSSNLFEKLNIQGSDLAVIIIVALAVVIVIALVAYIVLLSRRKKK